MTCRETQSLITPFINDQLGISKLQEFITHVQQCPECREELEVYYALLTAMNQLNEDTNLSDDYSYELAAKLEKTQEHIIHVKFTYYRKKSVLIFIVLACAIIASVRYVEREQKEDAAITESDFRIRRMYHEEKYQRITEELKVYIEENKIVIEEIEKMQQDEFEEEFEGVLEGDLEEPYEGEEDNILDDEMYDNNEQR